MMEWVTSSLLSRQRETKMLQSKVFFPIADRGTVVQHVMSLHYSGLCLTSKTVQVFDRAIVCISDKV